MDLKRCFKCGEQKPRSEFYRHPQMSDGLLGKCKTCAKSDVAVRYVRSRDKIRAYEQTRSRQPERRQKVSEYMRRMRARSPEKTLARTMVSNAIRDGRLLREPCRLCGDSKSQAHHADYGK